jgi:hypothetical protein
MLRVGSDQNFINFLLNFIKRSNKIMKGPVGHDPLPRQVGAGRVLGRPIRNYFI